MTVSTNLSCDECRSRDPEFRATRHITLRLATPAERRYWGAPLPGARPGAPAVTADRYIAVYIDDPDGEDSYPAAFFMPVGADTKREAVFWATRWASKNGSHYLPSPGWEHQRGSLK